MTSTIFYDEKKYAYDNEVNVHMLSYPGVVHADVAYQVTFGHTNEYLCCLLSVRKDESEKRIIFVCGDAFGYVDSNFIEYNWMQMTPRIESYGVFNAFREIFPGYTFSISRENKKPTAEYYEWRKYWLDMYNADPNRVQKFFQNDIARLGGRRIAVGPSVFAFAAYVNQKKTEQEKAQHIAYRR